MPLIRPGSQRVPRQPQTRPDRPVRWPNRQGTIDEPWIGATLLWLSFRVSLNLLLVSGFVGMTAVYVLMEQHDMVDVLREWLGW
jgi:hypothetical protein